jgi:RNA polymerase sigma-70 factor (ECF subfamily)
MKRAVESELIERGRKGDTGAISELFQRCYPGSLNVARRILRSEDDAMDAVQSAYLAAFRRFGSFRQEASVKTWLTRIVTNTCLMHLRSPERRYAWVSLDDLNIRQAAAALANSGDDPERTAARAEASDALSRAAGTLPKSLRGVFALCGLSGLEMIEASRALGLTVPAVKVRMHRARRHLRAHFRAEPYKQALRDWVYEA